MTSHGHARVGRTSKTWLNGGIPHGDMTNRKIHRLTTEVAVSTKAETYSDSKPHRFAPEGTVAKCEVIIFDDGSIHVGGPAIHYGEEYMVAALKTGLELLGYEVDLTECEDGGVPMGMELDSVVDPLDAMMHGPRAIA